MEIKYLKLIKEIVEEGTIAAASEKLFLTPSALSQQLKEAENQLGTPIFTRIRKKMILTSAGLVIYRSALKILLEIKQIDQQITNLLNGDGGEIRISTECYTSYHWLPSILKKFQKEYPNVEVKIIMEATHSPLPKILSGELDLAVTSDPILDSNLVFSELFSDEMVAIVPEDHSWTKKKFVLPDDFVDQNLIVHSLPLDSVTVWKFFLEPQKIKPLKITILPLTEASIELVKAGMGIMVMAKWTGKNYLGKEPIKAVQLGSRGLKRKHFIATLNSKDKNTFLYPFVEFLKNELQIAWNF